MNCEHELQRKWGEKIKKKKAAPLTLLATRTCYGISFYLFACEYSTAFNCIPSTDTGRPHQVLFGPPADKGLHTRAHSMKQCVCVLTVILYPHGF